MGDSVNTRKFSFGKVAGATSLLLGLLASIVGIAAAVIPWYKERHNINGTWTLKTLTDKSTETSFRSMELTYTVILTHDGTHVSGKGNKLGEKLGGGTYTPYEGKARTTIELDGSLDGDLLDVVITEDGLRRTTTGNLKLKRDGKSWVGTFYSDAATSSGTATLSPGGQ